jgi:hypothetical protein
MIGVGVVLCAAVCVYVCIYVYGLFARVEAHKLSRPIACPHRHCPLPSPTVIVLYLAPLLPIANTPNKPTVITP